MAPVVDNPVFGDPLTEVTRKQRTLLLGVSALGATIAQTGLTPTKISALGIEFAQSDQRAFLGILIVAILYFLAAFVVYGASDFFAWRLAAIIAREEAARKNYRRQQDAVEAKFAETHGDTFRLNPRDFFLVRWGRKHSVIRALFEFALPMAAGIYAIFVLSTAIARI